MQSKQFIPLVFCPGHCTDDDDKIVWNASAQWWEVTLDVKGFSGFFAGSAGNNMLPLHLVSINIHREGKFAAIEWVSSGEQNLSHFMLQRSTGGQTFEDLARVSATNRNGNTTYRYLDELGSAKIYFYRLQIFNKDSSSIYSKIVSIKPGNIFEAVTLQRNPAKDFVQVYHPAATSNARILVIDMSGRLIRTFTRAVQSVKTDLYIAGLIKGAYQLIFKDKNNSYSSTLLVR